MRAIPVDAERVTHQEHAALAVSAGWPVLTACRAAVLEIPLAYGVAGGGLTAGQRREQRAARHGRRLAGRAA